MQSFKSHGTRLPAAVKTTALIGALVAASLGPAQAQVLQPADYAGVSGGRARALDMDHASVNRALAGQGLPTNTDAIDRQATGWKVFAGHRFGPNFAVEGGYTWLGRYDFHGQIIADPGTVNSQFKAESINAFAVGILPWTPEFEAFAKAGVGFWRAKLSANGTFAGRSSRAESARGWSPILGVGLQYHLAPQWTLRAEAERFFNIGKADRTGRTEIDLYSLGVQYHF
jgi:opacity protein-like surface antigen